WNLEQDNPLPAGSSFLLNAYGFEVLEPLEGVRRRRGISMGVQPRSWEAVTQTPFRLRKSTIRTHFSSIRLGSGRFTPGRLDLGSASPVGSGRVIDSSIGMGTGGEDSSASGSVDEYSSPAIESLDCCRDLCIASSHCTLSIRGQK